jgi:hypothetical protein
MMDGFSMNDEAVTPIVPRMTTAMMHEGDRWIFMVMRRAWSLDGLDAFRLMYGVWSMDQYGHTIK